MSALRPRASASATPRADRSEGARRDPRRSHVDGLREGKLSGDGYDPKRFHYVLVSKTARLQGVDYYEMLGYRIVRKDDGVKISGRFRENEDGVEWNGHVLMCCPKERHDEIMQEGPGGDTGYNLAAQIEKSIINQKSAMADTLRGLGVGPQHMQVVPNLAERRLMEE